MKAICWAIQLLNVADAAATLIAVDRYGAEVEFNPLIGVSPVLFVAVKVESVWICTELLAWRRCNRTLAVIAGLYLGTAVIHVLLWL